MPGKITTPGLSLPEDQADLVYEALSAKAGWSEKVHKTVNGIPQWSEGKPVLVPNPVTRAEAARQYVIDFVKKQVKIYKIEAAAKATLAELDSINID